VVPGRETWKNHIQKCKTLIKSKKNKSLGKGETPKEKENKKQKGKSLHRRNRTPSPGLKCGGPWRPNEEEGCAAKVRIARVEPRSTDSFPFQPERSRDPINLKWKRLARV
jgi:hypothetical protein